MQGTGLPRNPTLMIKWWRAAALQGIASSQYALAAAYRDGRMVRQDLAVSRSWSAGSGGAVAPTAKQKRGPATVAVVKKTRKQIMAEEARLRAEEAEQRRFERYASDGGLGGR